MRLGRLGNLAFLFGTFILAYKSFGRNLKYRINTIQMPHRNVQRAKKLRSLQGKNCLELAFDKLGSYEVALVNRPVLLPSFSTKLLRGDVSRIVYIE